jgi:phosphatidylglycerol:prolipoprotein diacylglycerol transferase
MSTWLISRESRKVGYDPDRMFNLAVLLFVVGLVGARLLYVIVNWSRYRDAPAADVVKLWEGGLVWYGGILAAVPFAILYLAKRRMPIWGATDVLYIGCIFGLGFARWGCLLAGCCYGQPCDLPWAISYHNHDSVVVREIGEAAAQHLHPTPIYASLLAFGITGYLVWLQRRKRFDGQVFAVGLGLYAIGRFLIEFVRGDRARGFVDVSKQTAISTSQMIGIAVFAFAVLVYVVLSRRARRKAAEAEEG